jgi:tRNA pseudouridine55 synthase
MPSNVNTLKPSGVLVVDKPEGVTSHDAVSRARKTLGFKKIGHAGTLDPFATGVLILLVGEGTKLSNYLMDGRKTYIASIKLGEKRDTADLTGEIIDSALFDNISLADIKTALTRFEGEIEQLPPMYSALKKNGVPLYKYARKGIEIERKKRLVVIDSIKLLEFNSPYVDIEVTCSKGTYIRTLAEDIAASLGTLGHLVKLRRTRSGALSIDDAISFEDLLAQEKTSLAMTSLADSISTMSKIVVSEEGAAKIRTGAKLIADFIEGYEINEAPGNVLARVLTLGGSLVSIAEILTDEREYSKLSADSEVGKSIRVFN